MSSRRNQSFAPGREPLQQLDKLSLNGSQTKGPIVFLNPTSARFGPKYDHKNESEAIRPTEESGEEGSVQQQFRETRDEPTAEVSYKWTSRNNRKGRHALEVIQATKNESSKYMTPPSTSSIKEVLRGIMRMFTSFPVWDVSWLVAIIFTLGSIVWVINAFFVFLPLIRPETEFPDEILTGGGVTAFIGATIFEVGSLLLMVEVINENRTGCFGWAVESVIDDQLQDRGFAYRLLPSKSACSHHHRNKKNLVGKGTETGATDTKKVEEAHSWMWWPSWEELRSHYFHELGFLASFTQLFAASVFWISGFTALPGILNKMSPGLEDGIYWTPQIIGGTGFIISGALFMIETQPKWYIPAPKTLGWHIGLWNLIGGVGFTLCPAFGYDTSSWAQYQACLSTFWGSWAFLIGSVVQWYESMSKNPVEVQKSTNK